MKKVFLFIFLLFSSNIFCQSDLLQKELNLKLLFDNLRNVKDDVEKSLINQQIFDEMKEILQNDSSFYYSFDSLKYVGKVYSDDKKIRIYTWNVQREDDSFLFFGFIQQIGKDRMLIPLIQKNNITNPSNHKELKIGEWYGALYYKIVPFGSGKNKKYLLLGWRQNDIFANNLKFIDVLRFEGNDIIFGDDIFVGQNKNILFRVIFNYCPQVKMSLQYDSKKRRFVFDHLVTIGNNNGTSCFGPDFSYDAYVRKGGKWYLKQDIDVRNEK